MSNLEKIQTAREGLRAAKFRVVDLEDEVITLEVSFKDAQRLLEEKRAELSVAKSDVQRMYANLSEAQNA